MRATNTPDTNVSWVIRRFSSIVQRRRVLTSHTCLEVSTYPSWTLTLVSAKGIFSSTEKSLAKLSTPNELGIGSYYKRLKQLWQALL
jgi:hypothetical protein